MRLRGAAVMAVWAGRDLLRRPWQHLLLGTCIALLTMTATVPLLLTQALADTAGELLAAGPSLVVRRVDAGGFAPVPVAEALERARGVAGVTQATARVWGLARTGGLPVTVIGIEPPSAGPGADSSHGEDAGDVAWTWLRDRSGGDGLPAPREGTAVVGPGLSELPSGQAITLRAASQIDVVVAARLQADLSMAVHDVVVLTADDARELLGIPPGHASDLALRVFHDQEEEAILPDLSRALPWPTQITRRTEMIQAYAGGASRRGGLSMLVLAPAVLALILLVIAAWRDGVAEQRELGLLKVLGWTTSEVVTLRALRALSIGLPAVALGSLCGYLLVSWSGATWVSELLLGWSGSAVQLSLRPAGAALVLVEVAALVLVPISLASALGGLRAVVTDPERLLHQGHG